MDRAQAKQGTNQHVQLSTNCSEDGLAYYCRQRQHLGSNRASTVKPARSAYSGMILIEIRQGRSFLVARARALNGHVTVEFLTNESPFNGSRAEKLRLA
jgi:hypothetical protein